MILRVRDEKGSIMEIPAIKGDRGDPGPLPDMTAYYTAVQTDEAIGAAIESAITKALNTEV